MNTSNRLIDTLAHKNQHLKTSVKQANTPILGASLLINSVLLMASVIYCSSASAQTELGAAHQRGASLVPLPSFTANSTGGFSNTAATADEASESVTQSELTVLALTQKLLRSSVNPRVNLSENNHAALEKSLPRVTIRPDLTDEATLTRQQVLARYADYEAQGQLVNRALGGDMQATVRQNEAQSGAYGDGYYSMYHSFSIYDASSRLFEDFDFDGFYQTFSVTFDVDVDGVYSDERADVYAELYLSRDGGPWVHYYTTDVFQLYGNSPDDDYEVLTTLYTGFGTDVYDVLVDIYEVGYSDIVATISADEVDGLYALPLESSDRDQVQEVEVIVVEDSGGALSSVGLMLCALAAMIRRRVSLLSSQVS